MSNREKAAFGLFLIGLVAAISAVSLLKGGLYIDSHEGDALHLVEIVLRMSQGQWPHLDFVTPLGILAFAPISFFVDRGFGIGQSIILGQIGFAAVILPMIWWAATSRLQTGLAYGFGIATVVMVLALIHGQDNPTVSVSMHYNRWSWAAAFLAITVAALEPRGRGSQSVDGIIMGFALSFLILCKVTFAVALAPGVVLALVLRGQRLAMLVGLICVAISCVTVTIAAGTGFWPAYIGDLLQVSSSNIRPHAGLEWTKLILAPGFAVGNIMVLAAVYLLRKGENLDLGLILVLLAPGFVYVTFQNFGNDPKWLAFVAILLASCAQSRVMSSIALVCAALIAPSFLNMAVSPLRHLKMPTDGFAATFEQSPHDDFLTTSGRIYTVHTQQRTEFESPEFASLNELAEYDEQPVWRGVELPTCQQQTGMIGVIQAMAKDLDSQQLGQGKRIFTADTIGALWLFGASEPLPGGAPWYYGGLSGFEAADYLLVPTCPASARAFRAILKELSPIEDSLDEIRATELYTLYQIGAK